MAVVGLLTVILRLADASYGRSCALSFIQEETNEDGDEVNAIILVKNGRMIRTKKAKTPGETHEDLMIELRGELEAALRQRISTLKQELQEIERLAEIDDG